MSLNMNAEPHMATIPEALSLSLELPDAVSSLMAP